VAEHREPLAAAAGHAVGLSMTNLSAELADRFVLVNLGAASDSDYELPSELRKALTVVEVDATVPSSSRGPYFAHHVLDAVVADSASRRTFTERRWAQCSSLLEPRAELIEQYGLAHFFEIVETRDVVCQSLPTLLTERKVGAVDFLKTDLEGMDFAVLESCESLLPPVLAIQCELRFQPFYVGEPAAYAVASYLAERGFEGYPLRTETWKAKTAHRSAHTDGRMVLADWLFVRDSTALTALQRAKLVLILSLVGQRSEAEALLERHASDLPPSWISELRSATQPKKVERTPWLRIVAHRLLSRRSEWSFDHVLTTGGR
jgi:hypothetical protein